MYPMQSALHGSTIGPSVSEIPRTVNVAESRNGPTDDAEVEAMGAGGISGAPLEKRSLAVLKRLN